MTHYFKTEHKGLAWSPLPYGLVNKRSKHGRGVFTKDDYSIGSNQIIGLSHVGLNSNESKVNTDPWLIRTTLGGYINHSEKPNCFRWPIPGEHFTLYVLISKRIIRPGIELTLEYKDYDPSDSKSEAHTKERLQIESLLSDELYVMINGSNLPENGVSVW